MKLELSLVKKGYKIIKSNLIIDIKKRIRTQIMKAAKTILKENNYKNLVFKNINDIITYVYSEDKKYKKKMISSLYEILPSIPEIHRFASDNFFLKLAKKSGVLYPSIGTNLSIRIDRPFDKKYTTSMHQDFWYSFISTNSITIWFNLTTVSEEDGPLIIYKNSHKKIYKFQDNKSGSYTAVLKKDKRFNKNNIFLKEDEILIFNQLLLHESGQNISKKPRLSVQIRFNDLKKAQKIRSSYTCVSSNHVIKEQKKNLLN